jgi:hypothetical protein
METGFADRTDDALCIATADRKIGAFKQEEAATRRSTSQSPHAGSAPVGRQRKTAGTKKRRSGIERELAPSLSATRPNVLKGREPQERRIDRASLSEKIPGRSR